MLGGKFIETGKFYTCDELIKKIKTGYILLPWKEENVFYQGIILVKDSKPVGALVFKVPEDVPSYKGEEALGIIKNAMQYDKIKVFEIYHHDINEILKQYPEAKCHEHGFEEEILTKFREFSGTVEFYNETKMWELQIRNGKVLYAWEIGGNKRGDSAVNELLSELPEIYSRRKILFRPGKSSIPLEGSAVYQQRETVRDIMEILSFKNKIDENMSHENRRLHKR